MAKKAKVTLFGKVKKFAKKQYRKVVKFLKSK